MSIVCNTDYSPRDKIYEKKILEYIRTKPNVLTALISRYPYSNWNMNILSENPNITFDIVEKFIHFHWNWGKLSRYNPHITISIIIRFRDFWFWNDLTINPYISQDIIDALPEYPWNWDELSYNRCIKYYHPKEECRNNNLNMDFFEKYEHRVNWKLLSENPCLDFKIVEKYWTKPWNWFKLSEHKNLTKSIVDRNSHFPWVWDTLIRNPKINKFLKVRKCYDQTELTNPHLTLNEAEELLTRKFEPKISYYNITSSFGVLSSNYFLYDNDALENSMNKDNIISTILVFESIDTQKLANKADNITCKSSLVDYNIINMIKEFL